MLRVAFFAPWMSFIILITSPELVSWQFGLIVSASLLLVLPCMLRVAVHQLCPIVKPLSNMVNSAVVLKVDLST